MTSTEPLIFNPLADGYIENPYPHIAEMRNADPVNLTLFNQWILFRYDDVSRLLRDPGMSVQENNVEIIDQERNDLFVELAGEDLEPSTSMLGADPPDHTRLRKLVSKAFTPSAIAALRPRIQELVDHTLDAIEHRGHGDVVAELAFPLPFDVISEMLGMPESDKEQIAAWSAAIVKTLDPIISEEEIREAVKSDRAMTTHIESVIEWKREQRGDDLLTALIDAEEDGDRLSTRELRDQIVLLFIAGHETTVNLIGTGIYELLRHPDQLPIMRDEANAVNAIDELLRYVSPVQMSRRITLDDAEFGGKTIERGSMVLAGLAASNHDPAKWGPSADELDLLRDDAGQHMAFGGGVHYCLGASLAKLEAQVAIGSFVRRFPGARVDGDVEWNGRINLRGLEHLPVAVN
ncbi:MAG: cytochrome P450 [Acidimicrobiia bacterium]|nr:cytochrome P450 [Acidimicrobiia bacterium]